ncbi:Calx-beta domain-containing protein, partial [Eudoraea sp.]|uniref:Calx-beta domain-containing protein n=1 Tax=Eudoraea sp. TaxID=1979955 RepID=UPI003C743C75
MKFNPLLFTFILLAFFGLAVQSYGQETYLDNFSAVSYSNNNGTQNFSGNWNEINDNNNPNSGRIRITGGELRFEDISRNNRRIQRSADLTGAASATLSLDWRTSGLDGSGTVNSEQLNLQVSSDGISFTTIGIFTGSQSGSFSQDISAFISANTTIRLINVSTWGFGDWESGEFVFIDNVQISAVYSPMININDISVNENAGTATFTATHLGLPTGGPFTVNYQTVDGTATAGNDYTAIAGGIMSFNGTVGDTETIVVSITDDTFFEATETYTIQLTGTSDVSVNITDTGTGTINDNEVVLGNTPLTLFREFDGYMDYTSTAGTLRTQPNTVNACSITTSSSNTLSSPIPAGATIDAAYLYWSHSGATMDSQVTFEGTIIDAEVAYTTSIIGLTFYGLFSDVTGLVNTIPNPSTNVYDFSG